MITEPWPVDKPAPSKATTTAGEETYWSGSRPRLLLLLAIMPRRTTIAFIWLFLRLTDDVMNVSGHRLTARDQSRRLFCTRISPRRPEAGAADETTGPGRAAFVILSSPRGDGGEDVVAGLVQPRAGRSARSLSRARSWSCLKCPDLVSKIGAPRDAARNQRGRRRFTTWPTCR